MEQETVPSLYDEVHAKQLFEVRKQYFETWVAGAENKIRQRQQLIARMSAKMDDVKDLITRLLAGEFDKEFGRPSDKDNALIRYIDRVNEYDYQIDKAKREIEVFEANIEKRIK